MIQDGRNRGVNMEDFSYGPVTQGAINTALEAVSVAAADPIAKLRFIRRPSTKKRSRTDAETQTEEMLIT